MGFFSGFVNAFKSVGKAINKGFVKPLVKTFTSIPKIKLKNLGLNVLKFGPVAGLTQSALEVAHPKIGKIHGAVLDAVGKYAAPKGTGIAFDVVNSLKSKNLGYAQPAQASPVIRANNGGAPMAFNIGGFLGQVGSILGNVNNPTFQAAGNILGTAGSFIPAKSSGRPPVNVTARPAGLVATPAMASVPAVAGAAGRAMVSRGFFARFPNLATAIQQFRNTGRANITRKKLYGALKRFGPDMLITGGILTAAAVSELAVAGPGTKRMNPGNVKALRRSMRRLESFHRLCMKADKLRRPRHAKNARR